MTLEIKDSANYAAAVIRVPKPFDLPNADRLVGVHTEEEGDGLGHGGFQRSGAEGAEERGERLFARQLGPLYFQRSAALWFSLCAFALK